jgi:putative ABC transport system permease protein
MPNDESALASVRRTPELAAVDRRLNVSGLVSSGETTIGFIGEAVEPDAYKVTSSVLPVDGTNLSASEPSGVLLGRGLAEALGVHVGDTVSLIVTLPRGGISAAEGRVLGTFATQVKAYDDSAVRMPLALGRTLLRQNGAHTWVVSLNATEQTPAAVAYLKSVLPADRYEVTSWLDLSDFYRKAVALLSQQIQVVAILISVIIVLGISNTLMMNVVERTGEVGTLMAMGTSRSSVLGMFLLEGLLLGLLGAGVGLVVGVALAAALSHVGIPMPPPPGRDAGYSAEILLTWSLVGWAALMAVTTTTLAGIYPAWRAARMPIVDALRHNR